jgi:CHAT domain-containing protein
MDALADQIKQAAPDADQLILVPHRFLHLLPLHCLPLGSAPTTLLDQFARGVRFAPSLQVLDVVRKRPPTPLDSLFALQNPTEDLLYSDLEVQAIQSLFATQPTVLKRSEATKGAIQQHQGTLARSSCVHFACHGYFNFAQPLLSSLILAGSEITPAPDELEAEGLLLQPDGSAVDLSQCLTLLDVFQLDLRQARLVALSACETGLSELNSLSDEVVGLSSGFLYAGCNSVIGTLWTVPDISTALLMAHFYRLFKAQTDQGHPGDVALALKNAQHWLRTLTLHQLEAQRSTIPPVMHANFDHDLVGLKRFHAGEDCPFRSPYFWAAFTAVGQ